MEEAAPPRADPTSVLERLLRIGFGLGGVVSLATGVWMLMVPANWYRVFPGALPDTGPLNAHFVRDLGGWFAAGGVLMLFALTNPRRFGGVTLVVALVTYLAHASVHIGDIVSGRLPAVHWVIDTPLVFAPVVALIVLLWVWWTLQSQEHPAGQPQRAEEPEELPQTPLFYE